MSQIAYLECKTGISGDMCLGALVDLGVPLQYLQTQLSSLSRWNKTMLPPFPFMRLTQIFKVLFRKFYTFSGVTYLFSMLFRQRLTSIEITNLFSSYDFSEFNPNSFLI